MKKKVLIIVAMLIMSLGCIACESEPAPEYVTSSQNKETVENEESTMTKQTTTSNEFAYTANEIVEKMGMGWNLGNALDSCSYKEGVIVTEESFGNVKTTKDIIDMVKDIGFLSVRIPVSYYNHMDEDGNIDSLWLSRVKEVVDYVIDNDMYCIINIHHDTGNDGWLTADASNYEANSKKFTNMWTQIASYFKDYDSKLLFEGYNEILNSDKKWSYAGSEAYDTANRLNQDFVNTVRSTGGNNEERYLIVNTYAASAESEVISNFVLPEDTKENRLIVEVHSYAGIDKMSAVIDDIKTRFVDEGIPVIIGETAMSKDNSEEDRILFARLLNTKAKQNKIAMFWWDDGNYSKDSTELTDICSYALINRNLKEWAYEEIANAFLGK